MNQRQAFLAGEAYRAMMVAHSALQSVCGHGDCEAMHPTAGAAAEALSQVLEHYIDEMIPYSEQGRD